MQRQVLGLPSAVQRQAINALPPELRATMMEQRATEAAEEAAAAPSQGAFWK